MDFINIYFDEYSSAFTRKLEDVGITGDLATQFLPETASAIMHTIKNTNLEKTIEILLSDNPSQLIKTINVHTMAKKLGISSEQVSSGLESIAPVVSLVFLLKCNEIVAATASLAWKTTDENIDSVSGF